MNVSFNPSSASNAPYMSEPPCRNLAEIPGSHGLPVVGELLAINKDPAGFLEQRIQKFGQLSRMNLGPVRGVVVTHPDHLQQVFLDKNQCFSSAMGYEGNVSHIYPGSIILQDFAEHKASRRVFQAAFKKDALKAYVDVMSPTVEDNIADWAEQGDFRYVTGVRRILIDVGARVFFGLEPDPDKISEIARLFHEMNHVGLMALTHWNIPGTKHWRGQRAKRQMEEFIRQLVLERRANPGTDLTSVLASERDGNGEYWPVEALLPHLSVLLFAAHDTTAGATSHLMMYLARPENQAFQEKLRDTAFALNTDAPTLSDLEQLRDMDNAVNESIRLHPAVGAIMRRTTREVEMGNRLIPAHTMLFNMSHWAHRCPDYWTNPNQFDPDRFGPERNEHKTHSFQFLPFGGGTHKCIGMHFAMMNAKLILIHTLKKYRFELDERFSGGVSTLPLPFPKQNLPLKVSNL